jgi:hypothetical protein
MEQVVVSTMPSGFEKKNPKVYHSAPASDPTGTPSNVGKNIHYGVTLGIAVTLWVGGIILGVLWTWWAILPAVLFSFVRSMNLQKR